MKLSFYGVSKHDALFTGRNGAVIVNTKTLDASPCELEAKDERFWVAPADTAPIKAWSEVAWAALAIGVKSEVSVVSSGQAGRAYTVPKAVAQQATAGLRASVKDRGNRTPGAIRTARKLTAGGQLQLSDLRYMNKFFSANTRDTAGDTRWELWGGDAGCIWAGNVISSLPVTAAAEPEANLLGFYEGDDNERAFWGMLPPGSTEHVVGLYRRTPRDTWMSWGDGDWVDAEAPDTSDDKLIELDDDTAVYVASGLYDAPDTPVSLRDLDPEEWQIHDEGLPHVDWKMIDQCMRPESLYAAGPPGQYTPDERRQNVKSQPRDANGKFAKVGASGLMKNGTRAEIVTVNPVDQSLIVRDEQGNTFAIPAREFSIDNGQPQSPLQQPVDPAAPQTPPLNLDEILGQPRAISTTPKAMLPHLLPPMGPAQLKKVVDDYQTFIHEERQKRARDFKGGTGWRERPVRAAAELETKPTPDTTDVPPIYMALVDRDDPRAVTDLVALIPESTNSDEVTTFKRIGGEWVEDAAILQDLRSPTPPPCVKLDEATYQDVITQVDNTSPADDAEQPAASPPAAAPAVPAAPAASAAAASILTYDDDGNLAYMTAAGEGGLDRNRGNAERLRRYWLHGKGAAKIRWGTPGDWRRAYRHLFKYMGKRAAGYVSLLHKAATGMWPGDKRNLSVYSLTAGGPLHTSGQMLWPLDSVILASADLARARAIKQRVYGNIDQLGPIINDPAEINEGREGRPFRIPLVIPEGLESGDGRSFMPGSLGMRTFPLPLMWQVKTGDGHDGAFVVGRVDRVERVDKGLGNAIGVFDTGPYGQEAQRLVENRMLRWVSADLDKFEADQEAELAEEGDEDSIKARKLKVKRARLMGITLVAKPAFQECTIELVPLEELTTVADGEYEGEAVPEEDQPLVASASIARKIPVEPPKVWFERPILNGPTPITVTDEGQVFGHIATWGQNHIGRPDVAAPPRSRSKYAYFHTGVLRTAEGDDVTVGQLTLAGGHAGPYDDMLSAVKHYDDTGSAVADVHVGEDSYGIWAAGAVRPGTTPEQVRALRASAPSGDWRPVGNGNLELVAVCQVNVPGFPVPRAMVASGMIRSLVAAGTAELVSMKREQRPVGANLQARIARLEQAEDARDLNRRDAAVAKVNEARLEQRQREQELQAVVASARERVFKALDVDGYLTEFKDFSPERRAALAKKKHALKDGSFPIENTADLRRAVRAYGRASEDKKASVRRHIVRRARELQKMDLVPKDWREASLNDLALNRDDAKEAVTAALLERRVSQARKTVKGD